MKTFLSDFDILTNKRVVPHHSFTVQLTTISADDDITHNDGTVHRNTGTQQTQKNKGWIGVVSYRLQRRV